MLKIHNFLWSYAVLLHLHLLNSVNVLATSRATCEDNGYSMYVWRRGFDPTASYCNGIYPMNKNGENATCFYHNWETAEAREKLWQSCFIPGREVTRIFLADVLKRIENNGLNSSNECDSSLVSTLQEAYNYGIRVYALFADSVEAFSEKYMATYVNHFNNACGTDEVFFDGVAVNNEFFSKIRTCSEENVNDIYIERQQALLDNLLTTANNASPLPLHFSVSWNWDCCDCGSTSYATRELRWPAEGGVTKSVLSHMIDIVDSVDVQVAYIKNSTMANRSAKPYQYWLEKSGKSSTSKVYVLAYTNPGELCQTSFSPHVEGSNVVEDECGIGNPRTETGMFQAFDHVENEFLQIKGGIHFMNGVFGSGITAGWPVHEGNPAPSCFSSSTAPTNIPTISPAPNTSPTKIPTAFPTSHPTSYPTVNCVNLGQKPCQNALNCKWVGKDKLCIHNNSPPNTTPPPSPTTNATPSPSSPSEACPVCGNEDSCCAPSICETSGKPTNRACISNTNTNTNTASFRTYLTNFFGNCS